MLVVHVFHLPYIIKLSIHPYFDLFKKHVSTRERGRRCYMLILAMAIDFS